MVRKLMRDSVTGKLMRDTATGKLMRIGSLFGNDCGCFAEGETPVRYEVTFADIGEGACPASGAWPSDLNRTFILRQRLEIGQECVYEVFDSGWEIFLSLGTGELYARYGTEPNLCMVFRAGFTGCVIEGTINNGDGGYWHAGINGTATYTPIV